MVALERRLAAAAWQRRVRAVPRLSAAAAATAVAFRAVHDAVLPVRVPSPRVAPPVDAGQSVGAKISRNASPVPRYERNGAPPVDASVPVLANVDADPANAAGRHATPTAPPAREAFAGWLVVHGARELVGPDAALGKPFPVRHFGAAQKGERQCNVTSFGRIIPST